MTLLNININKIAVLRNSRGNNFPDIIKTTINIKKLGINRITVHPRPDERHIKYQDVINIKNISNIILNVEGNPCDKFIKMILEVIPYQVTLVPDKITDITSNNGWNIIKNKKFLSEIILILKKKNIKTSIFINPDPTQIIHAYEIGVDSIELNTGIYARYYEKKKINIINIYKNTAIQAEKFNININAGHDLNLKNIYFFLKNIPIIKEVSIGHALIIESIFLGLKNTINSYIQKIKLANNEN